MAQEEKKPPEIPIPDIEGIKKELEKLAAEIGQLDLAFRELNERILDLEKYKHIHR